MKFVDEVIIKVQAGKGGSGCKHFHREKFVPLGGPDGGNGGAGGSVILTADRNKSTLLDFTFQPHWKAKNGNPGEESNREGKSGDDLVIQVPVGTQAFRCDPQTGAYDPETDLVVDLEKDGDSFVLAKGGRGGKGNAFFKSPTNRTPEKFQPGEEGEAGVFLLSLKLVAEVGLIGFPNAGKSTLISRISAARPKIADYPFTTLTPNLGVAQAKGGRSFVVADIPGLIPGAHEGKGLGIKFLKHVERTKILAHLIDPLQLGADGEPVPVRDAFEQINHELRSFSAALAEKPQLVAITKMDSIADREKLKKDCEYFKRLTLPVYFISSVSGEGLDELLSALAAKLAKDTGPGVKSSSASD